MRASSRLNCGSESLLYVLWIDAEKRKQPVEATHYKLHLHTFNSENDNILAHDLR